MLRQKGGWRPDRLVSSKIRRNCDISPPPKGDGKPLEEVASHTPFLKITRIYLSILSVVPLKVYNFNFIQLIYFLLYSVLSCTK